MEETHANPLYFHDNSPPPFVTIRVDPKGQESRSMSTMGHTDFLKVREVEDVEDAEVLTTEEEALLQVHQTKKMRSTPDKEPINLLPNIL